MDKDVDEIVFKQLSRQLSALKEPSIWTQSKENDGVTTYRFMWLATHRRPTCIRVDKRADTVILHISQHDGSPGMIPGKLILSKDRKLTNQQWLRIQDEFERATFWSETTSVQENEGGADGDDMVFEGARQGKYHIMLRAGVASHRKFYPLARTLMELAGADFLHQWDEYRRENRS